MTVSAIMEGEAAAWVVDLYSKHAGELGDIGLFLSAMQERFEDNTRLQQVEGDLLAVRQRDRPVGAYIKDFRNLARKVQGWPD